MNMREHRNDKSVIIISITSDIGNELSIRFKNDGWKVVGTFNTHDNLKQTGCAADKNYHCNLLERNSIMSFLEEIRSDGVIWDAIVCCAGSQKPIGTFFTCNIDDWSESIHLNAIEQLRAVYGLYDQRNKEASHVIFFAGGGTNSAVPNFSAYTASKIFLIKMVELLHSENEDMNFCIIGPGWVKTKIHREVLNGNPEIVGLNYWRTLDFLENGIGTSHDDIYDCVKFVMEQGRAVCGGRNFSVVNDEWKDGKNGKLISELLKDGDMYKLRRCKNGFTGDVNG